MIDLTGYTHALSTSPTVQAMLSPVTRFGEVGGQTYWLSYIGAMCTAAVYYLWSRRKRFTSFKGVASYVMPKKLWRHPSTRLDIQLFIIGSIYLAFQGSIVMGSQVTASWVTHAMASIFGPGPATASPQAWVGIITPVLLFLALELGYWFAHYLMHRYSWLWEFHKVHHSAEVMTPMTEWRQHPVELLLFPVMMNLAIGIVYGLMQWAWGPESHLFPFWTIMTLLLLFFFTLLHLRHSHVKMDFHPWLGRILQSPAHHHIHHSTQPRHFNKNMGYCLSVWDWVFGTLSLPEKNQKIRFGIGDEPAYQTFKGCMLEPIRQMHRRVASNLTKERTVIQNSASHESPHA